MISAWDLTDCETFLRHYFARAPHGFMEIFYMLPEGVETPRGMRRKYSQFIELPLPDDLTGLIGRVRNANGLGYGVHFGCTVSAIDKPPYRVTDEETGREYLKYPRRVENDVPYVHALWCDIDGSQDVTPLQDSAFPPEITVSSGGGLHAYWLLNEPIYMTPENKQRVKRLLKALAATYGGDVQASDLARNMRLPDTINTKPSRNGAPCAVVWLDDQWWNTLDRLERQHAAMLPNELPRPTRDMADFGGKDQIPPVTRAYLNNPPYEGERNQRLYAAARGLNDAGYSEGEAESILWATAISTGLPEREIRTAIRSAFDAPRSASDPLFNLRAGMNDKRKRR